MAELKTKPTDASVAKFLASISDEARRGDCYALLDMMREAAGEPCMWGASIVGFGTYDYRYASGRSGTWFRMGFSPRKQALTLYLMLDLDRQEQALASLGKHKRGRGCLYIKRLSDIDADVLGGLIRASSAQGGDASCGGSH